MIIRIPDLSLSKAVEYFFFVLEKLMLLSYKCFFVISFFRVYVHYSSTSFITVGFYHIFGVLTVTQWY